MEYKSTLGRIPVSIVQIDQDLCCKTWKGTNACGDCNATKDTPCFNTFNTCQSLVDYALLDPLTLSFSKPQSDIPDEIYAIPSMVSISTSPGRINVGGRAGRDKPFGKRTEVTISFTDHPHSDNFVDPYLDQRTYDPLANGTFWGKWLKRNPYYEGRPMRLYEGYYGQSLAEMRVRHYVIDSITLPNSKGSVTLKALDILILADNKKAQAPLLSNGKLLSNITDVVTTFTVTGASLTEYTSYPTKILRVGDELMRYTTVVEDLNFDLVFSGVSRGSDNTTVSDHDVDDTVQACLEYVSERPDTVAYDLLTTYGNVAPSQIDLVGWTEEADIWLATYAVTRIITEPTGVTKLLGELSEQALMYMWWDDYANLVRLKAVHPPLGNVPLITEEDNLLQNSVTIKNQNSLRASEVWTSYKPITPLKIKDVADYKRTTAVIDPLSESLFAYGDRVVYRVLASWLDSAAIVTQLTNRLLGRYSEAPVFISFSLDAKDNDLGLGDVFDISYSGFVDETGQIELVRYQVISSHEIEGSVVKYESQKFEYLADVRIGGWMAEDAPDYIDATEEEKKAGCFWADDEGLLDGDKGYVYV